MQLQAIASDLVMPGILCLEWPLSSLCVDIVTAYKKKLCLLVTCSPSSSRANRYGTQQDRDDHSKASISSADHEGTTPVNELNGHPEPGNLLHVDHKPRLLLMGLKRYVILLLGPWIFIFRLTNVGRSGKSSISNVVFRKMAPHETLFLETTTTIRKEAMQ